MRLELLADPDWEVARRDELQQTRSRMNEAFEAKQLFWSLPFCAERVSRSFIMPNGRQNSPGSFRDELGGLIERIGKAAEPKEPPQKKPTGARVNDPAELNKHLTKSVRRKDD